MENNSGIILQEELITDGIELIDGNIHRKKKVEEGISLSKKEGFRFKQLKYAESLDESGPLEGLQEAMDYYKNVQGLCVLYENRMLFRNITDENECEKKKRTSYSELVICCKDDNNICPVSSYGITDQTITIEDICFRIDMYVKYLQEKKEVVSLRNGVYNVLLFPEVMGVLVHEMIGHICEADNYLDEQIPNYPIGYDFHMPITIYDDPQIKNAWGSIPFDDEGHLSEKVVLVKNGVINDFMSSADTAKRIQIANNGHARCSKYDKKPIVRMTNTVMQAGTDSKMMMIQNMKSGIIAQKTKGGYMYKDFFGVSILDGLYIRDGKVVGRFTNCMIRGRISDVLNHITNISSECDITSGRGCMKRGQGILPVSVTAPYVTFESLYIEQK